MRSMRFLVPADEASLRLLLLGGLTGGTPPGSGLGGMSAVDKDTAERVRRFP